MTLKPANTKDNSKRRFDGGGPRPDNNEIKANEATERQAAWSKLTPAQQLEALDRRLGKGVGAAKQRVRLQALINSPKKLTSSEFAQAKNDAIAKNERAKDRRERERTERPSK